MITNKELTMNFGLGPQRRASQILNTTQKKDVNLDLLMVASRNNQARANSVLATTENHLREVVKTPSAMHNKKDGLVSSNRMVVDSSRIHADENLKAKSFVQIRKIAVKRNTLLPKV